ncbi:hypothetical protein L7F22_000235 [Adiantum nelumboides]|nr:hypothetical protein [Adiantum nelumboides]
MMEEGGNQKQLKSQNSKEDDQTKMIKNLSLELKNERHLTMAAANETVSKINQLQVEKAFFRIECSQVRDKFDLHFAYSCENHHALKQVVFKKNSEIEDLNPQLSQIKNLEFSLKLDVMEKEVLNDDVVLNDLYDVGTLTNLVTNIGSGSFSKETQILNDILDDLYQVLDVNGFVDAKEMVLTSYVSLLQNIDDDEVGFLEDGFAFLCVLPFYVMLLIKEIMLIFL